VSEPTSQNLFGADTFELETLLGLTTEAVCTIYTKGMCLYFFSHREVEN
jgi:hypothetical protein